MLFPVITAPDLVIELDAITLIRDGTLFGSELFPESVIHEPPQFGFGPQLALAKPLKEEGAFP